MTRARLFVTAAALAFVAPTAGAATQCVNPAGSGGCLSSIQAAVTAAGPGDVVKVSAGTYFENVTVPVGKDGLQIVGASKLTVILDPDLPNVGSGITIQASGVQVRNLTIRNGLAHGVEIQASGVLVQGVRVFGARGTGIMTTGGDLDDIQILGNEIRGAGLAGIVLNPVSPNAVVKDNVVMHASQGIAVYGSGVQVLRNKVSNVAGIGLRVIGDSTVTTGNLLENVSTAALDISGQNPVVGSNRLIQAGSGQILCIACSSGSALGNTSLGSGSEGFLFGADGPGFVAQSNKVSRAALAAFVVSGTSIQATLNVASDTGIVSDGRCFRVLGSSHTLTKNVATRCSDNGFLVAADDTTLDGNVAAGAGVSGFMVDGYAGANADNTLTNNKSSLSNGAGFAVVDGAVSTVLTGNSGAKNRYDYCDDGTGTDVSGGNVFGSASTVCDILQ